ncbi:MAG: NFACT family protein [Methanoregulaceae archaeon]|jgi:predicted ribosome quality control (RQC) complex YloA/Tae2 family protein|nr:NFACT family protein [Methanoregulaceae archaeon]
MATTAGISGIDVRAIATELKGLLPLWINKVYQFDGKTLGIRLNGEEHKKYQLIIEPGRRLHLTGSFPDTPKVPPQFPMLLRKHLTGGKILDIRQQGLSRIIIFDIGKADTTYHVLVELFDAGNVVFCEEDFTIIKPLWHHRFKDRDVIPGVPYQLPVDPTLFDEAGFASFLQEDPRDIVKALAVGCLLGGSYAEYICRETGIDKHTPAPSVDPGMIRNAVRALLDKAETGRGPVITGGGCIPFIASESGDMKRFQTFNEALDAFYSPEVRLSKGEKKEKKRLTKEEVIRKQQLESVKKFQNKVIRLEKIIAAIYENYPLITEVISSLDAASKKYSWQEIEQILGKNKTGVGEKIVAVHPEEASVDLDLGVTVTIHVHENIEVNLGRYFSQVKKYKKKISGAKNAMDRPLPKMTTAKHQVPVLKKKWFHRFRWFYTSDGVLVLGGRDAGQNEELVKKYMEGGDTFVHADVHGASIVIIKGKTTRMDEVAQFAASFSGAWKSGHFSADVYSVRPDQVSKTPEAGEYVTRGSFIVRGERHYENNVPLGTAIGFQSEPEVAVIGGPVSTVQARAKYLVELKPGTFEPNDTAKKVLRILREKIPDGEWKAYKAVLNTEAVAAFVPPGGSDIVETS